MPPKIFFVLGGIGAVVQLWAFQDLYFLVKKNLALVPQKFGRKSVVLFKIAAYLLAVKLVMQLFSAHPYFARLAFIYKDFVIGYLHLIFLGIVITSLLAFLKYYGLIRISNSFFYLFLFAFVTTELLIFYKAVALWLAWPFFADYYILLALLSCIFPLAIGFLLYSNMLPNKKVV